jgi:hypothetical protein
MDTAVWYTRERFQDKGGSSARELEKLESVWVWRPFERDVLVCREIVRHPREFIPWSMKTFDHRG